MILLRLFGRVIICSTPKDRKKARMMQMRKILKKECLDPEQSLQGPLRDAVVRGLLRGLRDRSRGGSGVECGASGDGSDHRRGRATGASGPGHKCGSFPCPNRDGFLPINPGVTHRGEYKHQQIRGVASNTALGPCTQPRFGCLLARPCSFVAPWKILRNPFWVLSESCHFFDSPSYMADDALVIVDDAMVTRTGLYARGYRKMLRRSRKRASHRAGPQSMALPEDVPRRLVARPILRYKMLGGWGGNGRETKSFLITVMFRDVLIPSGKRSKPTR